MVAGMFAMTGWVFTHFESSAVGQLVIAVVGMIAGAITVVDSFRRIRRLWKELEDA